MTMPVKSLACVVFAASLFVAPVFAADDLEARENEWLATVRRSKGDEQADALRYLALVREERGRLSEALATWHLLDKVFGTRRVANLVRSPAYTWRQYAAFFTHRIARKRNLAAKPPQIDTALRKRLGNAVFEFAGWSRIDQLDLAIQADLDGDGVDELVYKGKNGPLGKRTQTVWGIARWDGKGYAIVWRGSGAAPFMMHVRDADGDGWKEVFCGWTPDSDDAATLVFNGKSVLFQ